MSHGLGVLPGVRNLSMDHLCADEISKFPSKQSRTSMARVKTAKQAAVAQKSKTSTSNSKGKPAASKDEKPKDENVKKPTKPSVEDSSEGLKAEILALGGDEEDYELVKDIDSDVELQAGPSSSKKDVRTNFN